MNPRVFGVILGFFVMIASRERHVYDGGKRRAWEKFSSQCDRPSSGRGRTDPASTQ